MPENSDSLKNTMELDPEGFLVDYRCWNKDLAEQIARSHEIELTDAHREIILTARQFFEEFDHAPSQRPLARYVRQQLNAEKAASIYLMQLFGASPAKMIARIAGLPKPKNCL